MNKKIIAILMPLAVMIMAIFSVIKVQAAG